MSVPEAVHFVSRIYLLSYQTDLQKCNAVTVATRRKLPSIPTAFYFIVEQNAE